MIMKWGPVPIKLSNNLNNTWTHKGSNKYSNKDNTFKQKNSWACYKPSSDVLNYAKYQHVNYICFLE